MYNSGYCVVMMMRWSSHIYEQIPHTIAI